MDQNERMLFDAYMRTAEFNRELRAQDNAIQWRGNFAAWGLMIGIATVMRTQPTWHVFLAVVAVLVLHIWWLRYFDNRAQTFSDRMWDNYNRARGAAHLEGDGLEGPWTLVLFAPIVISAIIALLVVAFNVLHQPENNRAAEAVNNSSISQQPKGSEPERNAPRGQDHGSPTNRKDGPPN